MPCTPEAQWRPYQECRTALCPAKAANAGGVATSALEMSQNSMRFSWSFEEVDEHLKSIMTNLYQQRPMPPRSTARKVPGGRRQHRGLPEGGRLHAGLRLGVRRAAE